MIIIYLLKNLIYKLNFLKIDAKIKVIFQKLTIKAQTIITE